MTRRLRLSGMGWGGRRAGLPPWYTENSAPLFMSADPRPSLLALPLCLRVKLCKWIHLSAAFHILMRQESGRTEDGAASGGRRRQSDVSPRPVSPDGGPGFRGLQGEEGGADCKAQRENLPLRCKGRIQIHPRASPCLRSNAEPDIRSNTHLPTPSPSLSLSSQLLSPPSGAWINEPLHLPFPLLTNTRSLLLPLSPVLTLSLSFPC